MLDNAGNTVGENGSINICLAENKTDEYNVSEYIYTITDTGSGSAGFGMEIAREMVKRWAANLYLSPTLSPGTVL